MGKTKQLLRYKGKSMVRHMLSVIMATNFKPVIVVTGANAAVVEQEFTHEPVVIAHNSEWKDGIASSIGKGLRTLQENYEDTDGVVIMLADQPYISPDLLNKLSRAQKESGKPIVASRYESVIGTPALFHKSLFPELLALTGDRGAGKFLQERLGDVATIDFSNGIIDIDTPEDYMALLRADK